MTLCTYFVVLHGVIAMHCDQNSNQTQDVSNSYVATIENFNLEVINFSPSRNIVKIERLNFILYLT